ncbi:MAG: U32 family peptidase [Lachnospiraceae bacterium]|nr:U32 family peptidase [Lachnospiraceae bacterium]
MTLRPELLLPAGNLETLRTAVRYGADAVYFGAKELSLRARAQNFDLTEISEAMRFLHERGKRGYLTANVYAREQELSTAEKLFADLEALAAGERPDAILIADPGMLALARQAAPSIPLHISTQANTTNSSACRFWQDNGASRIVLARELSLDEIRRIRDEIPEDLELECFVHGAMCISYSGRCLLSRAMVGEDRDGNRGSCAHPCRYEYAIVEAKRPGVYHPIAEGPRGTEILASDDLCLLEHLPELMRAGISSFKVEGRMKNALYVASVARCYRFAIDRILAGEEEEYRRSVPRMMEELRATAVRPLSTGFCFDAAGEGGRETGSIPVPGDGFQPGAYAGGQGFLGVITGVSADGAFRLTQRNKFSLGDEITVMRPGSPDSDLRGRVLSITTTDGETRESAPHPMEQLLVRIGSEGGTMTGAEPGDVVRMENRCRRG